jgi:hypothetical protein
MLLFSMFRVRPILPRTTFPLCFSSRHSLFAHDSLQPGIFSFRNLAPRHSEPATIPFRIRTYEKTGRGLPLLISLQLPLLLC